MKLVSFFLVTLGLLISHPSYAQSKYSVSVTRKESNLYKIDNKEIWVQTRYCYQYVYYEDAILTANKIIFLDKGATCDVKRVLEELTIESGSYELSVTHEENDLYSTLDGFYIQTSMCLELALSEEALLRINPYGSGSIVFLDNGRKCDVERVLRPMRL